jgi:signal transduction histidine kinase
LRTVGFPVQLLRAGSASLIAIYTIRSLRAFDVHRRRQLAAAQMQAQEMVARRDALRGDLFRRAVSTQEEERRRIARELHDEIGQTLTGLAAGLRGVQQSLTTDMEGSRLQLRQLEGMVVRAIGELGNLVADLRPSLLDDLGLQAALSWYVDAVNQRGVTQVELVFEGLQHRLPPEVETIFFRITQEALTNVTRHAKASQAVVEFACDKTLARLRVSDDGEGFTPEPVLEGEQQVGWGLVGIRERVQLAGGKCIIDSAPGRGTVLTVEIPLLGLKEDESGAH